MWSYISGLWCTRSFPGWGLNAEGLRVGCDRRELPETLTTQAPEERQQNSVGFSQGFCPVATGISPLLKTHFLS